MSTIIKGGTIVTADMTFRADIQIDGETIAAIGQNLSGDESIDASGCYVMPGGIDPHTHLEMPFMGTTAYEDFSSGTRAAISGGTTMIVDFVLPNPGQSLVEALQDWYQKAGKAAGDYFYQDWDYAARRVMSPPFRDKANQDSLWAGLASGSLQVVATDHCAFTTEQKRMGVGDFRKIPNGTGGLEDRLPVLWTKGVRTGRLTMNEFVAATSSNIAKILNIYPRKGAIAVGSDADLVIWDPEATKTISADKQASAIDYNVFEGFEVTGLPRYTLSRGEVVFREGNIEAEDGRGRFIERPANAAVNQALSSWKALTTPQAVERRAENMPAGV